MQQCRAGDVAALHAHAVRAAGLLSPNRAAPTIGVATQPIGDFMENELEKLRIEMAALRIQLRANEFASTTLITAMLRALHDARILNLYKLQEDIDEQFVRTASLIAIGGDAAEMANQGINRMQKILENLIQTYQKKSK
jgi:hypothetical protein